LAQSWEHAITDVGIVFVDKGETVPPGWELISTTVRAKVGLPPAPHAFVKKKDWQLVLLAPPT
jgi:hypothetical protein